MTIAQIDWSWVGPVASIVTLAGLLGTAIWNQVKIRIDQASQATKQANTDMKVDNLSSTINARVDGLSSKVDKIDDKLQAVIVSQARVETHLGIKGPQNP